MENEEWRLKRRRSIDDDDGDEKNDVCILYYLCMYIMQISSSKVTSTGDEELNSSDIPRH